MQVTIFSTVLAGTLVAIYITSSYVSFKALSFADLAVYSLFAMLGSMLIPFTAGILYWNEDLEVHKVICCILVIVALLVGLPKGRSARTGAWYNVLVFLMMGLIGLMNKFHQSKSMEEYRMLEEGFIVLCHVFGIVYNVSLYAFLQYRASENPEKIAFPAILPGTKIALLCVLAYGLINWAGNLLPLKALLHVPTSVQFPMMTGLVIVMTTLASFTLGEKPEKRTVLSALIAVAGLTVLIVGEYQIIILQNELGSP